MELESVLHADEEDQASDIIKLLLMRGVDPNTRAWSDFNYLFGSHSFSTPLQNAVVHRRPARLNFLLSHSAGPNFAGWPNQRRPIEVAIGHQSPDLTNADTPDYAAAYVTLLHAARHTRPT
ncbi:putative nacht and ankyrin domain protein [Diplodia seriata]|uniref:Putative nacht and ankyrin domain protein n=1 Tax=Diplodia seriata TaxID=420778 RepID=A0A0G2ESW1_9PEZI|nr:putative nacht and ankyrin domain protein [Diplodia seriata]